MKRKQYEPRGQPLDYHGKDPGEKPIRFSGKFNYALLESETVKPVDLIATYWEICRQRGVDSCFYRDGLVHTKAACVAETLQITSTRAAKAIRELIKLGIVERVVARGADKKIKQVFIKVLR